MRRRTRQCSLDQRVPSCVWAPAKPPLPGAMPHRQPSGGRPRPPSAALHSPLCSFSHLAKSPQELLPEGYLLRSGRCFLSRTRPLVATPGKKWRSGAEDRACSSSHIREMGGLAISLRSSPPPPVSGCLALLATMLQG